MKTIRVDGLLVLAPSGETVGVPGWATAPTLREALFTVAMVEKGHYNISHQPTKRAMPCSYGKLADALTVCAGLCELLAEDEAWWDPYRLTMPGALGDWQRANPEVWATMKGIVEQPQSYEKWPVKESE